MEDSPEFPLPAEAEDSARKTLAMEQPLCAECRGRFFGRVGHGWTNPDRLAALAKRAGNAAYAPLPASPCVLCHGAFERIPQWVERALRAAEGYEWRTFLCGSRWEPSDLALEEALWTEAGTSWGESLKVAFNREFGKAVAARSGKEGTKEGPDLLFLADVPIGAVTPEVFSLFLRGRYRKHDRTIPQTRWPCRSCRGKGCQKCGGSGKQYPTSVEELVAGPINLLAQGNGHRFHGMGREDIDARMLGEGRPCVVEILAPHVRSIDLRRAEEEVRSGAQGRVEILGLVPVTSAEVVRVKEAQHDKTYRVVIRGAVNEQKIKEAIPLLAGRELHQRTPERVAHRRADLVRERRIKEVRLMEHGNASFTLEVRAQAGTYIKEFVTGDDGRTTPSLSGILETPLKVEALDVLAIHDAEVA